MNEPVFNAAGWCKSAKAHRYDEHSDRDLVVCQRCWWVRAVEQNNAGAQGKAMIYNRRTFAERAGNKGSVGPWNDPSWFRGDTPLPTPAPPVRALLRRLRGDQDDPPRNPLRRLEAREQQRVRGLAAGEVAIKAALESMNRPAVFRSPKPRPVDGRHV